MPPNFLPLLLSSEDGAHQWNKVPDAWHCPLCHRSKAGSTYLDENGAIKFYPMQLVGTAVAHGWPGIICNHCVSTLTSLKLEARESVRLTDTYSFVTPDELRRIIVPRPHSKHAIKRKEAAHLLASIIKRNGG